MQKLSRLFNDPGTEKRLFMKELVNYKDVSKNQREVWGSSRLTTKLNLVSGVLKIRLTLTGLSLWLCLHKCFLYHKT